MTLPPARRSPLVERQEDLDRLDAALTRATEGRPSLAVVAGEAGIGKTRLVRALEEHAGGRGVTVLRGDCLRLEDGELPFAPLAAALRAVPDDVLADLPRAARDELGTSFPQLWRHGDVRPSAPASDRHAQRRLFDSLLCLLAELGERAPILLVIEDFHWVDRSTRDFAGFLARGARDERILTVLTFREHDNAPAATVEVLHDLMRIDGVERLDLQALTRAGVDALARGVLGGRAPAPLVDQLHRRSHGNPFFAEELLASYLDGRGAALPAGVANTVLQRLRRVSEPAQHTLRLVAATRRPVTLEFLAATAGLGALDLNRALREALDQSLLVEDGAEPAYAFRHELMREAVYGTLHAGERRTLHAAIAEELTAAPDAPRAELAYHWREAGRRPEALLASVQAGLDAERSRAYAAAADDFRAAGRLWDELGAPPDGTPLDRTELSAHLADALKHAGDYDGSIAACEAALNDLNAAADPGRASEFHERLGALNSSHSEVALAAFEAALELLPASERAKRARLVAEKASALLGLHRYEDACRGSQEALDLASDADADGEAFFARTVLGLALASAGRHEEGEQCLRLALSLPTDRVRPDDLLRGYVHLGEALRLAGRFEAACAAMDAGSALAAELGMTGSFGWYLEVNAAADLLHLGRWAEAEARLAAARDHPQESWTDVRLRQAAGQLALARGDLAGAAEELELARVRCGEADPECRPYVYAMQAELALATGETTAALELVDAGLEAVRPLRELLYTPVLHATGARAAADAAARAIDERRPADAHLAHAGAVARTDELAAHIAEHPGASPPPTALAHLATCRAEVQRAAAELSRISVGDSAEDWDAAAALWAEAADRWHAVDAPYPWAYARWREAEAIVLPHGRCRRATDALRQAYEASDRLGARPLRSAIEALAERIRIDPRPAAPAAGRLELPMGLTKREMQTLAYLTKGMTNKRIAAELVISVRTVEVHVAHILGKLNVATRLEAVAAAHRLGLVGERPPSGARR